MGRTHHPRTKRVNSSRASPSVRSSKSDSLDSSKRPQESQENATRGRPYRTVYKFAEKNAGKNAFKTALSFEEGGAESEARLQHGHGNTFGKFRRMYPTNFRTYPDTERIESTDKEGTQLLFEKRAGTRTVQTDAFYLKAARMVYSEPPTRVVPKFVEQAMKDYEAAMIEYNLNQQQLARITELSTIDDSVSSFTTSTTTPPPPPKPSPFIRQYALRNLRYYPPTVDSPHPPFRVVYVVSKKAVSKLAVYRNLCRKKLAAAVETVFREHAPPGYEFMFFAKLQCVTTPQKELEETIISSLKNPNLYVHSALSKDRTSPGETPLSPPLTTAGQESGTTDKSNIRRRWKNNRPPLKWNWWKHALPNPLGRTRQPDEYLDRHCLKPEFEGIPASHEEKEPSKNIK
ncbi:hypothetical protein FBU30_008495 [Linnemannia zychae]|nr:hypothetical protein FBU30_008495 [Linnemannia zychae]